MMDQVISALKDFTVQHMVLHIILIVMAAAVIIVAMIGDLISGVKKAIANGEATTSKGYKKTCDKAHKYFAPFLELTCIDILSCAIIPIPIFSLTWAAWCTWCEFTSVREKAWKKEEMRKAEKTMNIVIENKEDIAKLVTKLLTKTEGDK